MASEQIQILAAVAQLTQEVQAIKTQNQELFHANKELRMLLNSSMSTIPIIIRSELENFLAQFQQALESRNPSETAQAIRELADVMKELKHRLTDSELMQADMNSQVSFAAAEIQAFSTRLFNSNLMKFVTQLEKQMQESESQPQP